MQGFNMGRYVPPDQEGLTTGNKLAGKHPLGARARHLSTTGSLTVRFEMPFAVWCTTCPPTSNDVLIGQGVRFNAQKKKVGNYYSTPIFSFRMRHTACGGWIEIRTDPKNTAYVVGEGGRKRDTGGEEEGGSLVGREIKVRMPGEEAAGGEPDAFSKLEGKVEDKKRLLSESTRVMELQKRQDRDWEDPYEQSKRLRRAFRVERKGREKDEKVSEGLKDKMSLGIELLGESEGDRVRAGMVDFGGDTVESTTRSKPMFLKPRHQHTPSGHSAASSSSKHHPHDHGKKGRKSKKPADIKAERKALLREKLSGNTKAVIDPFLSHERVWKPDLAKKRKAEKPIPTRSSAGAKDDNAGNDNESNGITKSEIKAPGENGQSGNRSDTALVFYGSDSD
ncbi:hypothetical protein FQN54_001439 [Arachnomyces sp. PD_36]|nr:hypothetical protein FQN54_001439 [Arachnomyces sp. PD_36]